MYCSAVVVQRLNLGIADVPVHARCSFFLKIQCVVKPAGANKSIQMLEAYQECPHRQTDKCTELHEQICNLLNIGM